LDFASVGSVKDVSLFWEVGYVIVVFDLKERKNLSQVILAHDLFPYHEWAISVERKHVQLISHHAQYDRTSLCFDYRVV
jgi:hypothetical protein